MKNPYKTLNIPADASNDEIEQAYRRKAMETHPDRGGKAEDFQDVKTARTLLIDKVKRRTFDTTGKTDEDIDEKGSMLSDCCILLLSIIEAKPEGFDIVSEAIRFIDEQLKGIDALIANEKAKISKIQRSIKRIRKKKGKENIITSVMNSQITNINTSIAKASEQKTPLQDMRIFLEEYEWEGELPTFANIKFY